MLAMRSVAIGAADVNYCLYFRLEFRSVVGATVCIVYIINDSVDGATVAIPLHFENYPDYDPDSGYGLQ